MKKASESSLALSAVNFNSITSRQRETVSAQRFYPPLPSLVICRSCVVTVYTRV